MISTIKVIVTITIIIKITKCRRRYSSNNRVDIKQLNQEYISLNRLTVKDVKFNLLRCHAFNRYCCINVLLIDISKISARENHIGI